MSEPNPCQRRAIPENSQCIPSSTAAAVRAGRKGLFPVTARLTIEPIMIPRITSKAVARPMNMMNPNGNTDDSRKTAHMVTFAI